MRKRGTMKQAGSLFPFIFLLSVLVPITSAFGQETEGDNASYFIKKGFESVPLRKNGDESNPWESNTYINSLLDDVDKVLATNQEGVKWNGIETYPEIDTKKKIDPVERKHQVNQYQPLAGHLNLLGAESIQKAYDKALESPVAEWNITLTQTEPAIAAGIHNALVQTANTLNSRYLSEIVFYDQLDNTQPWARNKILNAYNTCIHSNLQKQVTWYEALQKCSGDSSNDSALQPDYTKAEELPSTTGKAGDLKSMWTLKGHHRHHVDGKAHQDSKEIVSVVDELFAEVLKSGTSDSKAAAQKAKESWLDLFGDVEFHAKADERKENKGALSTTELIIKRVPPRKRAAEILGKMVQDRHKTLVKELKAFCEEKTKGVAYKAHTNSRTPEYENYKKEYWQATADEKNIQLLSTEGYVFNAAVGNLFLEIATDAYAKGGNLSKVCPKFDNVLKDYTQVKIDKKEHDIGSVYWNYSKFVAYGQLLSSYKSAMQFVFERSAEPGTTDHQYKVNALSMILEIARTDNVPMVQLENVQKLRQFLTYVHNKKSQFSGLGGSQLSSAVKANSGGKSNKGNAN